MVRPQQNKKTGFRINLFSHCLLACVSSLRRDSIFHPPLQFFGIDLLKFSVFSRRSLVWGAFVVSFVEHCHYGVIKWEIFYSLWIFTDFYLFSQREIFNWWILRNFYEFDTLNWFLGIQNIYHFFAGINNFL